ncbi:uncharacterized protein LOC143463172 [Clavelina lepadiformis]|uniref:SHSP domain-containing protein n=1 Tax=Clavelina lepadiformis TaxID=159417 RepID=A0ABP0GMR9_CLALP
MSRTNKDYEAAPVSSKTPDELFETCGGLSHRRESPRIRLFDNDPWSEWSSGRRTPNEEQSSIKTDYLKSSSSRSSRKSSGSITPEVENVCSVFSDKWLDDEDDIYPRKNRVGRRTRLTANFFRDDFDERMHKMIGDFDDRCLRSMWNKKNFFRKNGSNDDFFCRNRSLDDSFFQDSNFPSLFDRELDDIWPTHKRRALSSQDTEGRILRKAPAQFKEDAEFEIDRDVCPQRQNNPDKFEVDIDVKGFKPSDLIVKTEGTRLVIRAKSNTDTDEKGPNSVIKELKREFELPCNINPYDVVSFLMPDGYLRVEAPVRNMETFYPASISRRSSNEPMSPEKVVSPPNYYEETSKTS